MRKKKGLIVSGAGDSDGIKLSSPPPTPLPRLPPRRQRSRASELEDEPTSPTFPLAPFPPPPPAPSRSRAPEFYGFVAWAVTYLLFFLYFLWAILPDRWVIWLGVSWYPNRYVRPYVKHSRESLIFRLWGVPFVRVLILNSPISINREWALLVPAWTIVTVLLTYFTYFSMAIRGTPAFSDISTYTGPYQFFSVPPKPFKVPTLQTREGNTPMVVCRTPTSRTRGRMLYHRHMIYRSVWSIVSFTTLENKSAWIGNH